MQTLFKMYRALEQEARMKEREEAASAGKIEELAQAMFRQEAELHRVREDNRKLQHAAEEAWLQLPAYPILFCPHRSEKTCT